MVLGKSLASVYLGKKLNELNSVLYVILEIASKMLVKSFDSFRPQDTILCLMNPVVLTLGFALLIQMEREKCM